MAQLVEHLLAKEEVAGSSPVCRSSALRFFLRAFCFTKKNAIEARDLLDSGQADIRNPLRYLLITECCFAAYQEWLAPLLIQASPNPLLIALRN